jgi:N-acetylglucosamine kinase-like BadF-type ATPase
MSCDPLPGLGLGLDAGGTQTRWAVADAAGGVLGEGTAAPLSGLQLGSAAGREHIAATLAAVAEVAAARRGGRGLHAVVAGVTGLDEAQADALRTLIARAFGVAQPQVRAMSDIELACCAAFAPGKGMVVYAGTGAVAAFLDGAGVLQRAGGRGGVIDDAGGGHWIASRALRHIWRAEDAEPGAWRRSALAQRVFARIGGSDWAATRTFVYGGDPGARGRIGELALAVAEAAGEDAAALALLQAAGSALARLALALDRRVGPQPIALAGRVFELHAAIESSLRAALPPGTPVQRATLPPHHAAARLASAQKVTA